MSKFFKVKKEIAARGGFDSTLRTEEGEDLLLSEIDLKMISLTTEEKLAAIGGTAYEGEVKKTSKKRK